MAKFKPVGEFVTVQRDIADDKKLVVLADTDEELYVTGTIVQAGKLAEDKVGYLLRPGDKVVFNRHAIANQKLSQAGEGIYLLNANQVVGRISK